MTTSLNLISTFIFQPFLQPTMSSDAAAPPLSGVRRIPLQNPYLKSNSSKSSAPGGSSNLASSTSSPPSSSSDSTEMQKNNRGLAKKTVEGRETGVKHYNEFAKKMNNHCLNISFPLQSTKILKSPSRCLKVTSSVMK